MEHTCKTCYWFNKSGYYKSLGDLASSCLHNDLGFCQCQSASECHEGAFPLVREFLGPCPEYTSTDKD